LTVTAEQEAVVVMGTIWVVEQLVVHGLIDKDSARTAYDGMQQWFYHTTPSGGIAEIGILSPELH
jgi:hypothetical protein